MTQYRALTVWQPWATLIAIGAKRFEFRAQAAPETLWNTRIAIHAGKRRVDTNEVQALLGRLGGNSWQHTGLVRKPAADLLYRVLDHPGELPLSSVLCTAMMGQSLRNAELADQLGVKWANDSGRDEHAMWGWPLSDIEVLEPFVPATGHQGFWSWGGP